MTTQNLRASILPRKQKMTFLAQLTEDEFRDRVVRPLFIRLGFEDGTDTCGPDERGKDAIFQELNRFGEREVVVVQTKRGNLNLSRRPRTNLQEAITQLRTAVSTKVSLPASRRKVHPSKAYLCVSGTLNQAAKDHIVETIDDQRIHFLDANQLIPQIDENFPELWLEIDADIVPYFKSLKKLVEEDSDDPALVGASSSQSALSGAAQDGNFISLNLYRVKVEHKKVRGEVYKRPDVEEHPLTSLPEQK